MRRRPNDGGDVTAVNVGNGLLGGGSYGDVSVGVDCGIVQYRISSQMSSWIYYSCNIDKRYCRMELDNDGGGDITSVTVGNGLIGGGDVGDLSMSINTSYIQRRVQQGCDLGKIHSSYQSRWHRSLHGRY